MAVLPAGDLLRYHALRKPENSVAASFADGDVTWWELERRANRRARFLADRGVGEGDWVTMVLPNDVRFFEYSFALWKLGATPNVISPRLAAQERAEIIALADPRLVVAAEQGEGDSRTLCYLESAVDYDDGELPAKVSKYWKILGSGGSTGRPKLIVDHRKAEYDPEQTMLGMPADGVVMAPGPLYHNAPFGSMHGGLFVGAHIVGMPRFDPEEMLRLIAAHGVQWISIVPTMMHRIWGLSPEVRAQYDLSSLQAVWHSAAAIAPWLKQAWIDWLGAERIFEMYGGTEGLGATMITGTEWLAKPGSVGRAHYGGLQILRADGTEAAPGEIGEIYFSSPAPGERTYHYVGADPQRSEGGADSLGDLGWVDEDGYLFIADRRADLIVRGGVNVYPLEIENVLDAHPDIVCAIAVGLPDDEFGSRVHAIVETRAGAKVEAIALVEFARERLASYKVPESIELTSTPLRDDSGKARRMALREERIGMLGKGEAFSSWERRPLTGAVPGLTQP